jgi:hypothetical protein
LLKKLEHYGIVGKVNALVKSYLSERYQRVVMQNNKKQLLRLGNGQTWGTVSIYLESLIFVLFINDLPSVTSNKNITLVLYADDTSMIVTGSNPVQFLTEISTSFDDIIEWFRINLMYLN